MLSALVSTWHISKAFLSVCFSYSSGNSSLKTHVQAEKRREERVGQTRKEEGAQGRGRSVCEGCVQGGMAHWKISKKARRLDEGGGEQGGG